LRWRNGISNTHDQQTYGKALSDSAFAGSAQAFNNKFVHWPNGAHRVTWPTKCCEFVIIVPHNSAIGLSLSTAFKPVAMP